MSNMTQIGIWMIGTTGWVTILALLVAWSDKTFGDAGWGIFIMLMLTGLGLIIAGRFV